MTINCRGVLLDLSTACVMGILNTTPDSFYDGGSLLTEKALLEKAEKQLKEGAKILDVGGYSSRPGAIDISPQEEIQRIAPAIKSLAKHFPEALLSIDSFRKKVAAVALAEGAHIVNDISGGDLDPEMIPWVAQERAPYILMHMQGKPQNMQDQPQYDDVVLEVNHALSKKIEQLKSLGANDIILDPGFGFGKSITHNYDLLRNLNLIGFGEHPLLVGLSRKSMIYKVLKTDAQNALNGTTALHSIALLKGAKILRVHDVKEAKECIALASYYS